MKEFDFDELDRAVNSLMADVKKTDETPSTPASVTTTSSSTASAPAVSQDASDEPMVSMSPVATSVTAPSPTPKIETPSPTPAPISTPAPSSLVSSRPAPRPAPQRSGRFMDVVHPSSDMKTTSPPSSVPSREGVSIQPSSSEPVTVSPVAQPVIDVVAPAGTGASLPPASPAQVSSSEPVVSDDETRQKETEPAPVSEPWTSSPFLPDAQVEKRPLGGAAGQTSPVDTGLSEAIAAELSKDASLDGSSDTTSEVPVEKEEQQETGETTPSPVSSDEDTKEASASDSKDDLQLQAMPPKETVAMPAELDTDLVAIESGQVDSPRDQASSFSSSTAVLSTSSIAQQYDEQPTTGDTSHTPIYDNESAHQPLAHPAKKKSGWMLVVFIILILVVGGGLGAAAYFVGLI